MGLTRKEFNRFLKKNWPAHDFADPMPCPFCGKRPKNLPRIFCDNPECPICRKTSFNLEEWNTRPIPWVRELD